ncbi:LysR family transcriptional regulator [Aeromonas hydrophila]|uniref:LysR family transcriptional regulator n=1 Tax=Aeromonas hydrophila TaxID=644 RepID=UPI0035B7D81C
MHVKRLPNLSVLRAFEATVKHGSISSAAKTLHLTDGAVSRAVREFETMLGLSLFLRKNRKIIPTEQALALAEDISRGLDMLQLAIERASRHQESRKPLVISCEPTFLIRWLIPRLVSLQHTLGLDRELQFVSAGGAVEFLREGIDLAIRRNDFPIKDSIIAAPFLKERVGPVCRPELAALLMTEQEINSVLIHTATRLESWQDWSLKSDIQLCPASELYFEHFYLSLQAAVAGAGVSIGPLALVADDILSGILVAPYGFIEDGSEYVLMSMTEHQGSREFSEVLRWLTDMSKDTELEVLSLNKCS